MHISGGTFFYLKALYIQWFMLRHFCGGITSSFSYLEPLLQNVITRYENNFDWVNISSLKNAMGNILLAITIVWSGQILLYDTHTHTHTHKHTHTHTHYIYIYIYNDASALKPCLNPESSSDEGFFRCNAVV